MNSYVFAKFGHKVNHIVELVFSLTQNVKKYILIILFIARFIVMITYSYYYKQFSL